MDLPMNTIIDLVAEIESNNNANAIGDSGLAFGLLQIRQGALTDFNNWRDTHYKLKDVMGIAGIPLSKEIFKEYMAHYATEKRLGRPATAEDMIRIWNAGPNGWKKDNAIPYLLKYQAVIKKYYD